MIPHITIGPLILNTYGLCIAVGLFAFYFTIKKNPNFEDLLNENLIQDLLGSGIVVGILGGRLLYILENKAEFKSLIEYIQIWKGGLSVQGAIISLMAFGLYFSFYNRIPIIKFLDLICTHAPLLQAFGRIGCFMAGCCAGSATSSFWGVQYTHHDSFAPLFCKIHPTQLYSALSLLGLYIFFRYTLASKKLPKGSILAAYLIGEGLERFINDYFRYKHAGSLTAISQSQWVSLSIIASGLLILCIICFSHKKYRYESV